MERFPLWMRQRGVLLALGLLILGIIAGGAWLLRPIQVNEPPAITALGDEIAANTAPIAEAEPVIVAYISGAVQAPDVYTLPATARVKDLVLAAGGLTADADADQINLAEQLTDGAHIKVLHHGAVAAQNAAAGTSTIDINTASASDFEKLDGIGAAIAQRIVAYRTANGAFTTIEELHKITGVNDTVYNKIVSNVRVGSPAQ